MNILFSQETFKILGRHGLLWIIIGLLANAFVAFSDFFIAIWSQVFLKIMNINSANITLPKLFDNWQPKLWHLLLILLLIILLRGVGQLLAFYCPALIEENTKTRLRLLTLHNILCSSSQKFIPASETNTNVGEVFQQASRFVFLAVANISIGVKSIVLLLTMVYLAWKEAILSCILLFFIGLILLKINRNIRRISFKIPKEQKSLITGIERIARNWLLIKILRSNEDEYQKLLKNILNYKSYFLKAKFLASVVSVIPLFLGILPFIVTIFVSVNIWNTPIIVLLPYLFILSRFLLVASKLANTLGQTNTLFPYFKLSLNYVSSFSNEEFNQAISPLSIKQELDKYNKDFSGNENQTKYQKLENIETKLINTIEIKNISFAYDNSKVLILKDISLNINHGEQLGIIGKSGSGKSTLIGLIAGILQPTEGNVTINGIEAKRFFDEKTSVTTGYVGSEPFLIEGTIKDNLDYGNNGLHNPEAYIKALKDAHILETIENLPNRLDYWITENGEGLSTGQKQRICLARALLCKPQILILDEVSANLDEKTELEIALSVKKLKGKCIVIIASHKPGILKYTDKTIDLSEQ